MSDNVITLNNGWLGIPFEINGFSDCIAGPPDYINGLTAQQIEDEKQFRYNEWLKAILPSED